MDIAIDKTDENVYLKRKEVHGKVAFQGATPSQKQLADALATKVNAKPDAIFVNHVYTSFGAQSASFEAHVYESKEQLEKVVRLGKKAREKAAGKAPAAPAEKKEEKPVEAKKEEKKAEAKPEAKPAEAKKAEPKKEEKPAAKPAEAKKEEPKKADVKAEPKKEEPKKAEAKA